MSRLACEQSWGAPAAGSRGLRRLLQTCLYWYLSICTAAGVSMLPGLRAYLQVAVDDVLCVEVCCGTSHIHGCRHETGHVMLGA